MAKESKKEQDFWIEETLSYKNPDGSRGWIVKIRPNPKPKKEK